MAEGASAAMAEWAPSAWSLGTRTVCPSAPVSWPSHQIALQGRLPMSVRRRRKDWQLKFLPHNNGRAPNPRAVAHMNGKPAESRMLFFFQAEDGIRDLTVTGVQTCALPI